MSRLRRPFLYDRYFSLTVRLRRARLTEADFQSLALAVNRARVKHRFLHRNPVKAGLVRRAQDWRSSSVDEYSGMGAAEQEQRCGLRIDRVNMPSDPKTRT